MRVRTVGILAIVAASIAGCGGAVSSCVKAGAKLGATSSAKVGGAATGGHAIERGAAQFGRGVDDAAVAAQSGRSLEGTGSHRLGAGAETIRGEEGRLGTARDVGLELLDKGAQGLGGSGSERGSDSSGRDERRKR